MKRTLVIFEEYANRSEKNIDSVMCWNSYVESASNSEYSILKIVEENSSKLKKQYLNLIYRLGKLKINGDTVVEHFKIRNSFSLWWMMPLSEKCNYSKSTQINDVIKLMALIDWLKNKNYSNIIFFGSNEDLANSIKLMSIEASIDFSYRKEKNARLVKSFYRKLPRIVQAIVWLSKYYYTRLPLKGVGLSLEKNKKPLTLFVSYFDNLHLNSLKNGIYKSHYWGGLPKLLEDELLPSNWLHIYVQSGTINSPTDAAKILRKFNNINKKKHVFLDSFLSINLIFKVFNDWLRLSGITTLEREIKLNLGCYYPLLMSDVQKSLYGMEVVSNIITFNLFEKSMQYFSYQVKGFFLYEGQGWEYGLVSAWKNFGNGHITGVTHTPLKYWDLRFFSDQNLYAKNKENLINFPNYLAANGEFSKSLLIKGGIPSEKVIELEALRYGFLENFNNANHYNKELISNCLLVVTDYVWDSTKYQLEMLEKALLDTSHTFKIIIKPHPNCPIPEKYKLSFDYQISSTPIGELLKYTQIVFSSNATSASVDAYSAGKSTIIMLDPKTLNLSPLNGVKGVSFVANSKELVLALASCFDLTNKSLFNNRREFFFIDKELSKWRKALFL